MQELSSGWWVIAILITFFVFFLLSMVLRNHAAKKDTIGKSEKETVDTSVSIAPRKNTRKLE